VLLQEWTCPISAEKTDSGHWKTNYELWEDVIFGVDSKADRTAVGFRSDGSVVLLICDGRIAASKGATTLQLAKIMRGLGCKGALNLDGGGSTGMWVKGEHINDLTGGNRPLMTTLGFFSK
jgi:exopolysaccharide biosynthesis protein